MAMVSELRSKVVADRLAGLRNFEICKKYGIKPIAVTYHLRKAIRYGEVPAEQLNLKVSKTVTGRPDLTDDDYRQKLLAQIKKTERDCWEWQGYRHPKGYGEMGYRGRCARVHKLSYVLFRGQVPEGWDVCHTCDNPPCVNPLHLFAAPRLVNLIDMRNKGRNRQTQKTECPKGHAYTPENTGIDGKRGWRYCKTCDQAKNRLKAGWPEHLAYDMTIKVPAGHKLNFATMEFVPVGRGRTRARSTSGKSGDQTK